MHKVLLYIVYIGTLKITRELEEMTARFVRKPDALVFGMGFGTNSTNIPALMGKVGVVRIYM